MTKLDYERAAKEVKEAKKWVKPKPNFLLEDAREPIELKQLLLESQKKRYPYITMQDIKLNTHFLKLVTRAAQTGDTRYLTFETRKVKDTWSKLQLVSWIDEYTRFTWVEMKQRFFCERMKKHRLDLLKQNPYWSVRAKFDLIREVAV